MQLCKLMLKPTIMRISPSMSNLHCLLLFQAISMLFFQSAIAKAKAFYK